MTATAASHGRTSLLFSPTRWTLRTRLVVALVALLSITVTTVGVLTVVSLDRFLVGQLDEQLNSAVTRARNESNRAPDFDRDHDQFNSRGPAFLVAPGQATGTIGAIVVNERVVRADVGTAGPWQVPVVVTGLPLAPVDQTVQQLAVIITVVALVGLLAAGFIAAFIISVSLRPLRRVAGTATQVAGMPLDSGEVALAVRVPDRDTDPHTEVGQVGAAINHMLENVAAALTARHISEMRIRSFVADASHELRTPLASIRGYAELTRRSDAQLPADAANALSRIESESVRMTSLVEDLLLLARLDAGRPIEFEPVDLSALVVTCVSDAHVAGPDHNWDLRLPDEPVVVSGDADRLHQVLANLLANARVHTPPGTNVTVTLSTVESPSISPNTTTRWAAIRVHDNGPGIPTDLLPEVFGRFSRGDSSRSRAAGSTGLAIVNAVITAHHGTITVSSRASDTSFIFYLPLA